MLIDFVGNKNVLDELENNLNNNDISHCYLFVGKSGLGKYTTSLAFAKQLMCRGENQCCFEIMNFTHPDVKIIRGSDSIKKEEVEEILKDAARTPFKSKNRVFIIDEFQNATISAQNAFLKTLEEPYEHCKFILIANSFEKLLPTIVSRTRIIKFKDVSVDEVKNFLELKEGISEKNAILFSKIGNGSVKRSLKYAHDSNFLELREKSIEVFDNILNIPRINFNYLDFFRDNKENLDEIFSIFILFLKDILMYKSTLSELNISNIDKMEYIKRQKKSVKNLLEIFDLILNCQKLLNFNTNFDLTMEELLIKIGGIR